VSLEAESRGKAEALKLKKKLEQDIHDLEVALDAATKGRNEAEKNVKKYQLQVKVSGQPLAKGRHMAM